MGRLALRCSGAVFEELIQAVEQAQGRRDRLAEQMLALLPSWSLREVIASLQALRGVATLSAITLMAEIGDFRRFADPRLLMAWLGLVPCERSSGATTARGSITRVGNSRARRVLIEGIGHRIETTLAQIRNASRISWSRSRDAPDEPRSGARCGSFTGNQGVA